MTSSLVGSEMCIRDSAREQCWSWCHNQCVKLDLPVLAQVAARPSTDPVSYTHLTLPTICSV
eukprot:11955936-Prorocentrum_lima.AAC.1